MSGFYQWWLEYTLPDGNVWSGWINDKVEERVVPPVPQGEFFAYRTAEGWHGVFILDGQTEQQARENYQYVITNAIHRPAKEHKLPNVTWGTATPSDIKAIEDIMEYSKPVKYTEVPRFGGRLSDYIVKEKGAFSFYA